MANRALPKTVLDGTDKQKVLQQILDYLNDGVYISPTAPPNPRIGMTWWNTTGSPATKKEWNGVAWV